MKREDDVVVYPNSENTSCNGAGVCENEHFNMIKNCKASIAEMQRKKNTIEKEIYKLEVKKIETKNKLNELEKYLGKNLDEAELAKLSSTIKSLYNTNSTISKSIQSLDFHLEENELFLLSVYQKLQRLTQQALEESKEKTK